MKPVYKASDGSEHPNAEAAERHDALLIAKSEFEQAAAKVARCLGAAALTADGKPFNTATSRTYWRIAKGYGFGFPRLVELWVWPHNAEIDSDGNGAGLCVRWYEQTQGREARYESYRIDTLYADKKAAEAAHLAACKQHAKDVADELTEIEAGYKKHKAAGVFISKSDHDYEKP